MALSAEESDVMRSIIRLAIQKTKNELDKLMPRSLAPLIEKWKNDNHDFKLDGVALLGFCMVARKNVEVLLKEVKKASEKITLDLRLLISRQELRTEIGELPDCDVTKIARFTAEKNKITIADAHGDFWSLQTQEDYDDLEPLDEALYHQLCIEEVEPMYPELIIDTTYIEFNEELPKVDRFHPISLPTSTPTLDTLLIQCPDHLETLEDVETASHTVLTFDGNDDMSWNSPENPSPMVSPPLLASQTISPERFCSPELHLEPLLIATSSGISSEAQQDSEDPSPPKKPRLQTPSTKLSQYNTFKLQNLLKNQTSELGEALKTLRLEIQKTSKRPTSSVLKISPVRAYLEKLEPVSSEFRRRRVEDVEEGSEEDPDDVEPISRDSGIQEDVLSQDDVICASEDVDGHTETVIEDVRDDFHDSEDIFLDSEFTSLNLKDSGPLEDVTREDSDAPNAPEEPEKTSDAIKTDLMRVVEAADGKPIPLFSSISPSASRKSAARAFFAVLELTKMRELAPPTQNEPFGEIFISKNADNC